MSLLLRGAHLPDGRVVDVEIDGPRVVAVRLGGTPAAGGEDLTGYLLLTAPAEPHTHLDKALTWDSLQPAYGDLPAAVAAWSAHSATLRSEDVMTRARRTVREFLRSGATAIRTHANACSGADPLLALRALVALRRELAGTLTLQVVFSRPDLNEQLLWQAIEPGADLLGGAPHSAPDPLGEQRRLLRLAGSARVGLDVHTDETLDPDAAGLDAIAGEVLDSGFAHPVTASHCVSLGQHSGRRLATTVGRVRRAGIGVVTLPATNLYLQGRGSPTSPSRGITAVRALVDAGVPLGAGGDNVRDPFLPLGRADPFEAAALLVTAGHLSIPEAWDAVSTGARAVMGLPPAGVQIGLAAELLAVRATSLADAMARAPADRVVISGGGVVARTRVESVSALD